MLPITRAFPSPAAVPNVTPPVGAVDSFATVCSVPFTALDPRPISTDVSVLGVLVAIQTFAASNVKVALVFLTYMHLYSVSPVFDSVLDTTSQILCVVLSVISVAVIAPPSESIPDAENVDLNSLISDESMAVVKDLQLF